MVSASCTAIIVRPTMRRGRAADAVRVPSLSTSCALVPAETDRRADPERESGEERDAERKREHAQVHRGLE
jgi:hypothetical protein